MKGGSSFVMRMGLSIVAQDELPLFDGRLPEALRSSSLWVGGAPDSARGQFQDVSGLGEGPGVRGVSQAYCLVLPTIDSYPIGDWGTFLMLGGLRANDVTRFSRSGVRVFLENGLEGL